MPLISIYSQLVRGRKEGFAIPLFDAFDGLTADGLIAALQEERAPGIVAIYSGTFDQPNAPALAAYIRTRLEELPTPASLMLDHGSSLEQCIRAIRLGFTDVMFDGARLPLSENIAQTKAIVRAAHAVGVHVEAEVGHVGSGSEYREFGGKRKGFSDPSEVERFVAETEVDFLAVAVGSAHGLYVGEPQLDLQLLGEIRRRVDVPLVMHGGSGLSEYQFRSAVSAGISKINISTELVITTGQRVAEEVRSDKASYFSLTQTIVDTFKERAAYYLQLFGASGRA